MKTDLMENIAEALGIYISDLRQENIQMQLLSCILECDGYETEEWNKLVNYVWRIECRFSSEREAKDFFIRNIAGSRYKKI